MLGVGIIMLDVFGIFLISLFGNITVTNQQDYTVMKNTVEAAVYDSIDLARYRSGFCVCTNKEKSDSGVYKFNDSREYTIVKDNIINGVCPANAGKFCKYIEGEYILDKKVFAENFVRRFSENVKGNSEYQIIVQDVIEYPPKVSVIINSKNSNEVDGSNYTINNKIDAIMEMDSKIKVDIVENPPVAYETPGCYTKGDDIEYGIESEHKGWTLHDKISKDNCKWFQVTTYHYKANYPENSDNYVSSPVITKKLYGESYTTNSISGEIKLNDGNYTWNSAVPNNASGTVNNNVAVKYYYNKQASSCTWSKTEQKTYTDRASNPCDEKLPTNPTIGKKYYIQNGTTRKEVETDCTFTKCTAISGVNDGGNHCLSDHKVYANRSDAQTNCNVFRFATGSTDGACNISCKKKTQYTFTCDIYVCQ